MIGLLTIVGRHRHHRLVVPALTPQADDYAQLLLHDDVTRHIAGVTLGPAGLRALGAHLERCAAEIEKHHPPRADGDPACPPSPEPTTSPARRRWWSRPTSSSSACR